MPQINEILQHMEELGASDVHLVTGAPITYRIDGVLVRANDRVLRSQEVEILLFELLTDEGIRRFEKTGDLDTSYTIPGFARFRVNMYRHHHGPGGVLRMIPMSPPTLEELALPDTVRRLAECKEGLVLVTGPTNSGKSTTLAAMINHLNQVEHKHIITLEDPVEFVHDNKGCLVTQRQVGLDTGSFAVALRAAMREDPDVILVGEMRDLETIHLALTASELGLTVFGTLHTRSACQTISRVIDAFPHDQQAQIRVALSECLVGVISQRLVRRMNGTGRVPVLELMVKNSGIAHMIREGKAHQIQSAIQTGGKDGMKIFEQHYSELVRAGVIAPEREVTRNAPARPTADAHLEPTG